MQQPEFIEQIEIREPLNRWEKEIDEFVPLWDKELDKIYSKIKYRFKIFAILMFGSLFFWTIILLLIG